MVLKIETLLSSKSIAVKQQWKYIHAGVPQTTASTCVGAHVSGNRCRGQRTILGFALPFYVCIRLAWFLYPLHYLTSPNIFQFVKFIPLKNVNLWLLSKRQNKKQQQNPAFIYLLLLWAAKWQSSSSFTLIVSIVFCHKFSCHFLKTLHHIYIKNSVISYFCL